MLHKDIILPEPIVNKEPVNKVNARGSSQQQENTASSSKQQKSFEDTINRSKQSQQSEAQTKSSSTKDSKANNSNDVENKTDEKSETNTEQLNDKETHAEHNCQPTEELEQGSQSQKQTDGTNLDEDWLDSVINIIAKTKEKAEQQQLQSEFDDEELTTEQLKQLVDVSEEVSVDELIPEVAASSTSEQAESQSDSKVTTETSNSEENATESIKGQKQHNDEMSAAQFAHQVSSDLNAKFAKSMQSEAKENGIGAMNSDGKQSQGEMEKSLLLERFFAKQDALISAQETSGAEEQISPNGKGVNILTGLPFGSQISQLANLNGKGNANVNAEQVKNDENLGKFADFSESLDSETKLNQSSELMRAENSKPSTLFANFLQPEPGVSDQTKTTKVDVAGVEIDKMLQPAKVENLSQNRSELVLRENILFNKQELATHVQQQVGMMMARNMKSVDIRLDPPELGAMQVKLSLNNEQAAVSIVVSNQQTKDALENAMPKLKELLEQQGLELADSDVTQGNGEQQQQNEENENEILANELGLESDESLMAQQAQRVSEMRSPWNVDYYA